ncbi:hypothetical protein MLD38_015765 [Melastoma candidum]|uniref:Uncharacterized protein n=1 Tax=Melastoma candidum TaxID=119954 RepID=A0ACB9RIE4_9MYRT|nr:hypothetical protein MLD38_015765 [Melastoma candidum]
MVNRAWRIIPRPLMETVLNNHAQHHRVAQPLLLHGPRGVGKTTLILELLGEWNNGAHVTGYVDLAEFVKDHHPSSGGSFPWYSWSNCDLPPLTVLRAQLEECLESMAHKGVKLGVISSQQVFSALKKWHSVNNALSRVLEARSSSGKQVFSGKMSESVLWSRAVFAASGWMDKEEIDRVLDLKGRGRGSLSAEEAAYMREAVVALNLAKEILREQHGWRKNAIRELNECGGFSRSLSNSCTDWPCLLLELLSQSAEVEHFQPKLVINNIDVLRNAVLTDDSLVRASLYHDSLIWRIIALGANERCLPVILVTSDGYYSYRAFMDFGFPDIFISREMFGWTPQEANMHMVDDHFRKSEWLPISEVLGPNARHLFELYALKQSSYYDKIINNKTSTFEDIIDAYLAYLQITAVNPAMEKALHIIQKFAADARGGQIPKDKLRFGAPWRHPPSDPNPELNLQWAKLQLMDFVQSLVIAEFGVNYFADCSLEIYDDPAAVALLEVGLLYTQRDPSFMRPVTRGIQRCLVRWLVEEKMKLSLWSSVLFLWHRIFRGRSYRHLMLQEGYK